MPNFFLAYSAQFLLTTMVYQYVSSVSIHIPSITDIIIHYHIFVGIGTFFFTKKDRPLKKKKQAQEPPQYGRPSVFGP